MRYPFRTRLVAHGTILGKGESPEKGPELANKLPEFNSHRLEFGRHIKLFSDGAFFSQLAQMQAPGYIDGHFGEWLATPEVWSNIFALTGMPVIRFTCM